MCGSNPGFADRLITLLTEAGVHPGDLASRANVSLEVVEACLKGELPDAMALYRITKALDVETEWLVAGEEVRVSDEDVELTFLESRFNHGSRYVALW